MANQNCIICRKPFTDGIIVNGRLICRSCEHKLVNAEVNTDFYEYYKECIKRSIKDYTLRKTVIGYEEYR